MHADIDKRLHRLAALVGEDWAAVQPHEGTMAVTVKLCRIAADEPFLHSKVRAPDCPCLAAKGCFLGG